MHYPIKTETITNTVFDTKAYDSAIAVAKSYENDLLLSKDKLSQLMGVLSVQDNCDDSLAIYKLIVEDIDEQLLLQTEQIKLLSNVPPKKVIENKTSYQESTATTQQLKLEFDNKLSIANRNKIDAQNEATLLSDRLITVNNKIATKNKSLIWLLVIIAALLCYIFRKPILKLIK